MNLARHSKLPGAWMPILLLATSVPSLLQAQDPPLTREGRYWVRTLSGSGPISQLRMQVKTNGDVTVRGHAQSGYSYTVKLRVRATTEAQARRRLAELRVSAA